VKRSVDKKLLGLACALWACLGSAALLAADDAEPGEPAVGKPVVAVIPDRSEGVAPLADLLFAELSRSQRMDLVERAELQKILAEQELQVSFGAKGGKSRRRLGSLLRADFLVLLRIGGEGSSPALETVIAETHFGYRLIKQVRKWDPKQVELAAGEIASLLEGSLDRFSRGVTLAVAVPPFFSRNLTHRFDHLQAAYARVTEIEATRRPGCAVVELEEAEAIAEELATGAGDDRVTRPLPHYIVGEFRHETLQPDSPVTITLRLRHGEKQLAESSSDGLDAAAAAKFVRKTADDLLDKIGNGRVAGIPAVDPAKEVKALLRRADRFLEVGALDESAALYEAALLLDPDNIDTLDGAVESYVRMIKLPLSRRNPGKRNEAEWALWDELRKKEMRRKAYQAIRAGEHLTRLVRLKKYDSFYTMRERVQSVWQTARRMTEYGRFEGLHEEWLLLEQARRDFLLDGFPHTWRDKGWSDRNVRREYTDSWFYLITVIGYPVQREFADEEWFDYRLKLFQAVYKGKSRWYAPWVLLPKGCEDGRWAKEHGAEAVEKYVRLHESFVEQFKQVCGDPEGLALSLEYARLQREFSHRGKQPDLVVLTELTWLYSQCEAAGIWEGESAFLELLNRTAARHYASIPRFDLPTTHVRRRLPPKGEGEIRVGRLAFQPVKLQFVGADAKQLGSEPGWRGVGGGLVWIDSLVKCSPGIDVLWAPSAIAVMKEKGVAVEVVRDAEAEISDVCFDGKWLWAATRKGRLLLVDPVEGSVRTIGLAEGVPESDITMVVCPLEQGRICAVGSIAPHGRVWCATVTAEGEVRIFHEARRLATDKDDSAADSAFKPCWISPIKSADGKSVDRLLLCRDGLTVRSSSSAQYHVNRWALAYHPLVIDPRRLTVEVVKAEMPLGIAGLQRKDVVQEGKFLFFGTTAVKLADMSYQIVVNDPHDGSNLLRRATRCTFKRNDMLYVPPDNGSYCWIEVDPKTVVGKTIAKGLGLPGWDHYTYLPSWHYGIFGLSRSWRRPHFQVTVLEKSAGGEP